MTTTINNEHKKLNVPNLRFPEFQGEWEKCKLGDYGKVVTGNTPPTKDIENYENGTYLWASPADLGTIKSITETKTMLSVKGFSKTRTLPKGSVLVTCIGSTIGKTGMATKEMSTNQQINSIVVNDNNDNEFVYYAIQSAFPRYLSSIAVQAVPIISKSAFELLPNKRPCLQEQKRIGKFLSLLDERISTQNKIIEDLKKLKSAITDLLFHSIADAHTIRLGKIAHITNGAGDVQDANTEHQEDWYPFFDRSEELKWFPTYSFDKEAVIYAGEGQSFYPRYYNGKFALHQRCYAITDFASCIIPKYCYHFMNTLNSYFVRNSVGSTVPSLRMDIFQKVEIRLPPIPKQQHICKIIDAFYTKLEVEQRGISILQELKQFLLSQMFI